MIDHQDSFIENRNFIGSLIIVFFITLLLTLMELWQLIIIPGIIAGILNKPLRKATMSGALGILIGWGVYIIHSQVTRNMYTVLDQFAAEIFGSLGFGWIVITLILLLGSIFGCLGARIGNSVMLLYQKRTEETNI
jgi:hypothetical protein